MKRFFAFLFCFVFLSALVSVPALAYTADDGAGNLTETGKDPDTTVNAEGDYINITGLETKINGTVGGDVLGIFTTFTADGLEVGGSMRFVAAQTEIKNVTCRNLTFASADVDIGEGVNARAVVIWAMGKVEFSGVCDTLEIHASEVVIKGEIKNSAKIYADSVRFGSDASVKDITVKSAGKPVMANGNDAVTHFDGALVWEQVNIWKEAFMDLPRVIIYALAGAVIIQLVFGKSTRAASVLFKEHPIRFSLSGLFLLLSVPVFAMFMLMLSTEISTALTLVYFAFIEVSQLFAGSVIGARVFPTMNRFLSAIIATTTIAILASLPLVGGMVSLICLMVAFGYFSVTVFPKRAPRQEAETQQ
ncbi:MAG: hypothetical protein IKM27_06350 [Clostridia bacterium]|nr:hypothetical protein [Clostridia bacterium]